MTTFASLREHLGLSPATVSRALERLSRGRGEDARSGSSRPPSGCTTGPIRSAKRLATGKSGMVGMIFRAAPEAAGRSALRGFPRRACRWRWRTARSTSSSTSRRRPSSCSHYKRFARVGLGGRHDRSARPSPTMRASRLLTSRELSLRRPRPRRRRRRTTPITTSTMTAPSPPRRACSPISATSASRCSTARAGMGFALQREARLSPRAWASSGLPMPERFVAHGEMSEEQRLPRAPRRCWPSRRRSGRRRSSARRRCRRWA